MPHTIDRLAALRVADVMAKDLLTVSKNQTMSDVAATFARRELSSAPVVDELGHCVGVITASDFVRRESEIQRAVENADSSGGGVVHAEGDQPYRCVPVGNDYVSYHMTEAVQSVDPGASLLKAARVMCAEHIHRLLVIDDKNHPVGVISTMDIIAAMVNVVDEMNAEFERGGC